MKNITVALDEETWRLARIHAAAQGTSLSALVKAHLQSVAATPVASEVRDVQPVWGNVPLRGYATPEEAQAADPTLPKGAYGRFVDGAPFYTLGGRPRQPGAMRGMLGWTEDFDSWPEGFLENINEGWPGTVKWWLPNDEPSSTTS